MFLVLHSFADELLLIPENYTVYSENKKYFLECDTKSNITTCYEIPNLEIDIMDPANLAVEKYKIAECGLSSYISDNGEFCVLDFHGEVVPGNVFNSYILFKVYKNGKEYGEILLSDLVQKKKKFT